MALPSFKADLPRRYLTVDEAASYLTLSTSVLNRLRMSGLGRAAACDRRPRRWHVARPGTQGGAGTFSDDADEQSIGALLLVTLRRSSATRRSLRTASGTGGFHRAYSPTPWS